MRIAALDRKLLRDLAGMRGQAVAIGLVLASGIAMYLAYLSNFDSLARTRAAYYDRFRFASVFASCKPAWGHIHLGPEKALEAWDLLGKSAFLPVHWGTFSLAMHAWDEPAETLLALGPKRGVPLVMPQLGEPVEPTLVERVTPWWRHAELQPRQPGAPVETEPAAIPKNLPWPVD